MTEMTFSRPFSYHAPHVGEFFLVSRDSSCLLTNEKVVTGDYLCFGDKFHHVEKYVSHFRVNSQLSDRGSP